MTREFDAAAVASAQRVRRIATAFTCAEFGITERALESSCRQAHLVSARTLFVWAVRTFGPSQLSDAVVGRWLGGRDPSTIHYLRTSKLPQLRERDADFALLCDRFTDQVAKKLEVPQCQ